MNIRKTIAVLAVFVFLVVVAAPVLAASVYSWLLEGASNQGKECDDLDGTYADTGTTWQQLKLEGATLTEGAHTVGPLTVNISNLTGSAFDWSSNIGVDAVVVKDGQDGAYFYVYDGLSSPADGTTGTTGGSILNSEAMADTNLTTPAPGFKGISHISFCYEVDPDAPAIDIEKATNGEDADDPTGPFVPVGGQVDWTYRVENTGNVPLTDVTVTDDQGVTVDCPQTTLDVGESMVCTASGVAEAGQYENLGTVTGNYGDISVDDDDPSHYFGVDASIDIEKATNGEDADDPTGPLVPVGDSVEWTYRVENTGNVPLTDVMVTDDQGVTVDCPQTALDPGEWMVCTGSGVAEAGQYENLGTVTGTPPVGDDVSDEDPSHYFGSEPAIDIEKATNDMDADDPTGPFVPVGGQVDWTYRVENTGNVPLTDVTVTDDQGVTVDCPQTALDPGEWMVCTASGVAEAGQYENLGTVTGTPPVGDDVSDEDPSHYFGVDASIDIEKWTNGEDADEPMGPIVQVGDPVEWTYRVENTGNVPLTGITVADDQGVTVDCPQTDLDPGEWMVCTGSGVAEAGQYENLGTVTGTPPVGDDVSDEDPSHYFGEKPTVVTLTSFTAEAGVGSVALAWETAAEIDNAGFNLYRADAADGPYAKVNGALIAAEGDPVSGASYSFVDEGLAPGTYYYKLEDVETSGVATLHGPAPVTVAPALRRPSYRPVLP